MTLEKKQEITMRENIRALAPFMRYGFSFASGAERIHRSPYPWSQEITHSKDESVVEGRTIPLTLSANLVIVHQD